VGVADVLPVFFVVEFVFRGEGGGVGAGESLRGNRISARFVGLLGVRDVKRVLEIASGVLLGDVESIEVPETGLDVSSERR